MPRDFVIKIVLTISALVLSLVLYRYCILFYDLVYFVDKESFYIFNGTLTWNKYWVFFWGYLNHYYETYINFIPILTILIITLHKSGVGLRDGTFRVLYYIITLQLVVYLHKHIYIFPRLSPSNYFDHLSLITLIGNENLKCTSSHSFPSGHTVAFFYFFFLIKSFRIKSMSIISFIMSIFFSIPRLISGAHWLSDAVYAVVLAYFFYLTFYYSGMERKLNFFKHKA